MRKLCFLALIIWAGIIKAQESSIFLSIGGFSGRHDIIFKNYAKSPGVSFGMEANLGIYIIQKEKYNGSVTFGMLDGASNNSNRRKTSEEFVLVDSSFDKHLFFKFAQFRGVFGGWKSAYNFKNQELIHQIGFGIFGTTELDQLYDFAMQNQLGILWRTDKKIQIKTVLSHEVQIGIGNPNYGMNNLSFGIGVLRKI